MDEMRAPFRIGVPTAASLLVNGLLIAALIHLGVARQQRRVEAPSLTVMSLALLQGAEDGAQEAKASAPSKPTPPSEASAPASERAPASMMPIPTTMVAIPSLLAASPQSAPALQIAAAAAPAKVAPSLPTSTAPPQASASRRGVVDGLDVDAPAGTSRAYAARVRSWLFAHKIYPRRARMRREEGIVRVRFVLDRAGVLLEGHVIESSGRASLDDEANAMMQRASPYPKAPHDVPGDRIEFTAPIEFTLPV